MAPGEGRFIDGVGPGADQDGLKVVLVPFLVRLVARESILGVVLGSLGADFGTL